LRYPGSPDCAKVAAGAADRGRGLEVRRALITGIPGRAAAGQGLRGARHRAPAIRYVIATGESHAVREFCRAAFDRAGLDWERHVRVDADVALLEDELAGRTVRIDRP
jgi:hypothetical protein